MAALISKPGITSTSTLSIPKDWDKAWFRGFIQSQLKGADVRNAIGANGITVSGNIASPYATITLGPGPIVLTNPTAGTNTLTVSAPGANATSPGQNRAGLFLGRANSYTVEIAGSATSGQSYGLIIAAGSTAADRSLNITNQATSKTFFTVFGDGTMSGYGQTAAAAVDMAPDSGTFTATMPITSVTVAQTGTAVWAKMGNLVCIALPQLLGTSNSTALTVTGVPAAIQPTRAQNVSVPFLEDASVTTGGACQIGTSGTLIFFKGANTSGASWTNSATTKGLAAGNNIFYLLN